MANQSSIKIWTVDEQGKKGTPTLELKGRAMPYQGLELEGSMRAEFTWYPGNPVSTVQMLGAQEKATTLKGIWKDKFLQSVTDENETVQPTAFGLISEQPAASVIDLVNAVEEMRLSGQLLRFEWGAITRVGILTRFRQNWLRFEDCEWEMEFQWSSRGQVQVPVTVPVAPDASSFATTINKLVGTLKSAIDTATGFGGAPLSFQVIEGFVNDISAAMDTIDDAALEMSNAVSNATELISAPQNAAARALAASESIKESASSIVTSVEGVPPLELIKSGNPSALNLGDSLQADAYGRGIKAASRALQLFVAGQGDLLRASLDQDTLLAAFVARAPMDLRDVSLRYYNTPDEWRRLLAYNALETSALGIGALVLVPKITGADGRT